MDIHSNLEYLCRVCAANTKGKNSVAECVYILKTAGLKDKLDKFLYLKISENDSLPKVLCKSCFRQVEATAALSKIAQHTQQVFRDFLLSNLPKGPSEITNTSEYTSSDFTARKDSNEKSKKDEITAQKTAPAPTPTQMLPPPLIQPLTTTSRKDEVIVNVSVSDPLTRDNQQKMISNSQRRQSLLLESRYTPKSIAQKSAPITNAAAQKVIASKQNQTTETVNTTNTAKTTTTTTPTLNFYPINKTQQPTKQQQQPQQTTQITTFSSGGYVIGRINNDKEEAKKITLPLAPTADNVLQQKRKNLVKALNNIKANNSGQVSLLKSSQQKQAVATQNLTKTPLSEVVNQAAEDELPEKIIIAAPKNKSAGDKGKKEPLNLSSKIPAVVTSITQPILPNTAATITAVVQQQQQQQPQEQTSTFTNTPPKPAFPEDILLGRVIRDMDLLKLILKALKWPVNKQNMELQLQRLKNSKFTDIMSDSNLLQDTDLTQLLGPYLAPVLLAAQALQQQQQQLLKNTTLNQNMSAAYIAPAKISALEAAQAEINKSIPYKLPPETSVQLVPATPEEQEATQSPPLPNITTTTSTSLLKRDRQKESKNVVVPQKRQRRAAAQRARDSIVISDEEDVEVESPKKSRQRASKNSPNNIQIELNSNFMSQFNLLTGTGSDEANEALLALLQRQKAAIMKDKKVQRRRRNSVSNLITLPASEFDALIDLDDDIVLMEPVSTTSSPDSVSATSAIQETGPQKPDITNTFVIPSVPLITRPIIKRRKTVIHSSRGRLDTPSELKDKDVIPNSSSSAALTASKEKRLEETINQVAQGNMISDNNNEVVNQPSPTKTSNNEGSVLISADIAATKAPQQQQQQQKKTQNKATLGQQLLEAIGLQKISNKINSSQTETASSSTVVNSVAVMPNSKQSIQQIRSALKKSLKQAQEQQQQRKKELSSSTANNTIIQDADSTTKPAVKEIVVVEGKGSKSDNNSSMVDVEEQIDKVTLMVRKNDKDNSEQPTTSEKEDKKEMKKSPNTKIQERRRTMPAIGARTARNAAVTDETKDKSNAEEEEKETNENNEAEEENEKTEKEETENANISSSSGATTNEANTNTKEEVVTPKRRGRKRLVDKQNELETAEANENDKDKEKEKDNKITPTITERSRTIDKSKEEDTDNNANTNKNEEEQETASNKTSGRPTRQSKTQSKYYKGPDKPIQGRRSLPSRTTRNRKYS